MLESILFVRVDYEFRVGEVYRFPIRRDSDTSGRVRNTPNADDNFQLSTTFPS